MRESEFSHRAAEESLPLRDAFSVLFFVSVGMLFEPAILLEQPLRVLAVVAIIILGKALVAAALVLALRYPINTALTVAASLAQIGEFSFILAGLGVALGLLPAMGMSLVLAGALISIALNPLLFAAVEPFRRWVLGHSELARRLEQRQDPFAELPMSTERKYLEGQVVLVGYGRVGQRIAKAMDAARHPLCGGRAKPGVGGAVAQPGCCSRVRQCGRSGSADTGAHIAHAAMLVIATPDTRRCAANG
jgi:CPA2 family monovalent cation:H+ antiporter-2